MRRSRAQIVLLVRISQITLLIAERILLPCFGKSLCITGILHGVSVGGILLILRQLLFVLDSMKPDHEFIPPH